MAHYLGGCVDVDAREQLVDQLGGGARPLVGFVCVCVCVVFINYCIWCVDTMYVYVDIHIYYIPIHINYPSSSALFCV